MNTDPKQTDEGAETPIYLTSDSTLQTTAEHQHDQSVDPRKDTTMEVSNTDLRETETDKARAEQMDGMAGDGEGL